MSDKKMVEGMKYTCENCCWWMEDKDYPCRSTCDHSEMANGTKYNPDSVRIVLDCYARYPSTYSPPWLEVGPGFGCIHWKGLRT